MATYCISDIHGNIKALCALLKKIDFHYDGSDQLYLLGDYVDWGPSSMETLFYCMRLSTNPFITCLMGNHDLMLLNQIKKSDFGKNNVNDLNWLYNNRGFKTWEEFLLLDEEQQQLVFEWLDNLPFSAEVNIKGKWYLLSHAGPFLPEESLEPDELERKQFEAVWYRISGPNSNPLKTLSKYKQPLWEEHKYSKLICGHSITYHFKTFSDSEPFSIFFGRYFIDIDCGAKCLGLDLRQDSIPDETMLQCRLAALRIDDMSAIYCDRTLAGYPVPGGEEDEGYDNHIKCKPSDQTS